MVDLAAPFLDSLLLGSLYTMMALGLTITYKVTRVPNFAHAELVAVGSYAGVVAVNTWGRGLGEALLLAFAASAAVALAADELVSKPLLKRGPRPSTSSSPPSAWASGSFAGEDLNRVFP